MIDVQHLTRRYGSHVAVEDLSFQLERGEVVGFLGPNGAGKTTTMRMLTGFLPATRGSVRIAGFDVLTQSMEVRRRIGYLPENVPLYREHRIEEMLRFQGRLHGMAAREAKRRGDEILERVGLTDRRRSLIGSLSRGLRQRAGLAVALLPAPEVLILDEPTSGLDPLQRIEVRDLVAELAAEHTVLLSSHILAEIEALCPRVIILNKGRMAADGTPEELTAQLGGGAAVRLEAFCPDPDEALTLLKSLPGVDDVRPTGRLGIHSGFDVVSTEDVREDVGALAAAKGWAIRELSWRRPSLERIFASIALEMDGLIDEDRPGEASVAAAEPDAGAEVFNLDPFAGAPGRELAEAAPPGEMQRDAGASKTLNPFENFGATPAAPPAPGAAPSAGAGGATLNPFENFGQPPKPPAEPPPAGPASAEGDDA